MEGALRASCMESKVQSLYVHVPFCARKCEYCAFYSHPAGLDLMDRYVSALVREFELVAHDLAPRTVFFGGGTPSILSEAQWEKILSAMDRLRLLGAEEWTVECNPATVSRSKAELLRAYGVNRISMGVQSMDPAMLARLGRIHSKEKVLSSYEILRKAGFENINLDVMFAVPGQTMQVWKETLEDVVRLQPEHVASYEVIYEEDTPLFEQLKAGRFDVDEDLACDMYEEMVDRLGAADFEHYEIANFGRRIPGGISRENALDKPWLSYRCCRHNVNYWRGGSFYGLGPSATGCVRGVRTRNMADTALYCELLAKGRRPVESTEELPPLSRAGETAAFGLRMVDGWPFEQFSRVTGYDLRRDWIKDMENLAQRGWAHLDHDRFRLTREGLRFADAAAESFLR